MTRSHLKNLYNKTPNVENEMNYKKQKYKRRYYHNIDIRRVNERLSNRFLGKTKKANQDNLT